MTRRALRAALVVVGIAGAASMPVAPPAVAQEEAQDAALTDVAARLSAWLAAEGGFPAVSPPPLRRASEAALKTRCFPVFPPHLVPRVLAAYDARTGVIYLSDALDLARPVDRSYLLHELVHHAQRACGAMDDARCKGRLEGEAIRLQLAWLAARGVEDPLGALGFDDDTLRMLERCP